MGRVCVFVLLTSNGPQKDGAIGRLRSLFLRKSWNNDKTQPPPPPPVCPSPLSKGHFEMFLCNTADMDDPDGVVKQSCFNKYPLDRASGDSSNSPVDPDYPGR